GPGTLRRARNPIQYRQFMNSEEVRRRYWARSVIGWPRMARALPNETHHALAALERSGILCGVITQNVDRLHHAAGSTEAVELHGALAEVRCLDCGAIEARSALQERLLTHNPGWTDSPVEMAPDGDAEVRDRDAERFQVVGCRACAGVLKPNVVFFGESVPRPVVDRAWQLLDRGQALLVVGSSLTVFSGYRFVRRAAEREMPIAIVNIGPTRGDPLATIRVQGRSGDVLPRLAAQLGAS
ncbi:MAG: NAD-dependent protein deacetylase, partial [Myxococcota bacterium]